MMMNVKEFIDKYCQDIVKNKALLDELLSDAGFDWEKMVDLGWGECKCIEAAKEEWISILHILEYEENDFRRIYPSQSALEAYRRYLSKFKITKGPEVMDELRNQIRAESAKIDKWNNFSIDEDVSCSF